MNKSNKIEVNGVKYTKRAHEELSGFKSCVKCKITHPLSHYKAISGKPVGTAQYKPYCGACNIQIVLDNYYANREAKIEYQKQLNKLKIKQYRPRKSANDSKRRANKRNATPNWLTNSDLSQINLLFETRFKLTQDTGIEHQVDHIIPLNGTTVCGLHVPWNLRVITKEENANKSATLDCVLLSELYTGFEPTEITPELYYLLSQHDDKLKFKQT